MDFQRIMLIGAIAVLSLMLLVEWGNFEKTHRSAVTNESARLISPIGSSPAVSDMPSDLPMGNESTQPAENMDDLPVAPDTDSTEQATPATQSASLNSRIVQVETDVLKFVIDLEGGDIIELSLPQYPEEQGKDAPFVLLEQNEQLVYIARSGLIGPNGIDSETRAQYSTTSAEYRLGDNDETLVVDLTLTNSPEIKVTKRYTLHRNDYLVDIEYLIENNSQERWQANLFGQIKRGDAPPPSLNTGAMGKKAFLGVAITQPDDHFTKFTFDDLMDQSFKLKSSGGWIAMIQHYFLSAWIPNPQQSHNYSARHTSSGFNIAEFTSPAITIDPSKSGQVAASFYAGPKDQYRLRDISPYLDLSVDYGWLWWIAQPLFWLLTKIQSIVGNWGVAIILLTVLIKASFFRLSAASYRSMANMRRVQPKMADIREQYADDKQKQSQAMMELYKKEKINPMGGCLPILVQMPVFISLYWMLMESVELRQSPFFLWIKDLSVMDPYFVLPLLMGASMWFMQRLNPPPPDPMQAKIMQWMPIMFTFFFLWFPSGLVLYWLVNNLLSIAQQYYITRQIEKAAVKA